jgi:hypothetical protein
MTCASKIKVYNVISRTPRLSGIRTFSDIVNILTDNRMFGFIIPYQVRP